MEEAKFYEGELGQFGQDELAPRVRELEEIRADNLNSHQAIVHRLTTLIQ